jgi:hypothetical protein
MSVPRLCRGFGDGHPAPIDAPEGRATIPGARRGPSDPSQRRETAKGFFPPIGRASSRTASGPSAGPLRPAPHGHNRCSPYPPLSGTPGYARLPHRLPPLLPDT